MAKYRIPYSSGAWISPFDGKTYGGGAEPVVPDSFEPSIYWEPLDDAAKENHAAQKQKKADLKKEQEAAAKAGLTFEEHMHKKAADEAKKSFVGSPFDETTKESETI